MSTGYKVLCGVPEPSCTGGRYITEQQLSKKAHTTHEEAFKCMVRYLMNKGYTRLGSRMFSAPDGGPIEVLTKRSRFGARLRSGKEQQRYMPKFGHGVIVG